MKKTLVIGVILLFLGVGFQPALANEISTNLVFDVDEDCLECQAMNRAEFLRVKLILIRLEVLTNILLSKLSHLLEIADNCRELFYKITSLQERINDLKLISLSEENSIICYILYTIAIGVAILGDFFYEFADKFLVNFPKLYEIFTRIFVEGILIITIGITLEILATIFDCDFNPYFS